jgi:hypothetical protein
MNRFLAVVTTMLVALTAYQWTALSEMRSALSATRQQDASRIRAAELASFNRRSDELMDVMQWLDGFYRSADGLQRPSGLCVNGMPDFDGIRAWVFDTYLRTRTAGASPEAARQQLTDTLLDSNEWRAKHSAR